MTFRAERALELAKNRHKYGTCYPEKLAKEALELMDQIDRPEVKEKVCEILRQLANAA